MNRIREKSAFSLTPLLLSIGAGALFFFAFFYVHTFFPLPSSNGLNPLRDGKILFALQGRNPFSRLLSSSGRGERANSQNRRTRNGTFSALLPGKEPILIFPAGSRQESSPYKNSFYLFTTQNNNPARAGPAPFFPA